MSVVETVLVLFDVEFFVLFFAQVLRTGGPTPTTFSRSLRTLVPLSPHLLQSPATNPHSYSGRSKQPPQVSLHQYFLRESPILLSYRESSNGPTDSSAQSLASSSWSPFSTAPSLTAHSAFSNPFPPSLGTSLPSGGDGSSLGPSLASSPSPVEFSQREAGTSLPSGGDGSILGPSPAPPYSQRDPRFKCSICPDLWFRDHFNLERHNKLHNEHHDHVPIICKRAWCNEEFLTKSDRKAHFDNCVWSCPEPLCDKSRMCYFWAFSS